MHNEGDDVGIASEDIANREAVVGVYLDADGELRVTARAAVPLGHKIAIRALRAGDEVTEYGARIGVATSDIAIGDHVHTHNIRSARW